MVKIEKLSGPTSLPDKISKVLIGYITSGQYKPGEKLPTEKELALSFGVSRAVVREAISRLKIDALVESKQGAGVFVSKTGAKRSFRVSDPDSSIDGALGDLFELRACVEAGAAGLAAQNRTSEQLASIETAFIALANAIESGEDGIKEDHLFHQAIAEASGNTYFGRFVAFLGEHILESIAAGRKRSSQYQGRTEMVQTEHKNVFDAIAAKHVSAAETAMRIHLMKAAERLGVLEERHSN